jgi:WD40 repeat protein
MAPTLIAAFEAAWQRGEEPDLAAYLARATDDQANHLRTLVRLDIQHRRRRQLRIRVEDYLTRFTELNDDDEVLLDLIHAEFHQLVSQGDPITIEAYGKRFPRLRPMLSTLAPTPPLPDAGEGTPPQVAGYEILGILGRGGMGVVWKARQMGLHRLVALKMIVGGQYAGSEERVRFLAEAEAVASLAHPGIVQVHAFGTHTSLSGEICPYLALEYCPGGSLADKLDGRPLPPAEASHLVEQIACAVQVAHEKGIIHRDLKPGNVLLTLDGQPKITDFGLAKRIEAGPGLTQSGAVVGTPSYMAPEQAKGQREQIASTTDVYSLGAILYECLTGRPPFVAATSYETIVQVLHDDPVPPRDLVGIIPPDLETICVKCLQKEPSRRYRSARELADDLGRWRRGEPIKARPVGWLERLSKWSRRHRAVAVLSAAFVLSLITGSIVATMFAFEAHRQARLAYNEAERADTQAELAAEAAHEAEKKAEAEKQARLDEARQRGLAQRRQKEAEAARDLAETSAYRRSIALAHREYQQANPRLARRLLNDCPPARRNWEWHYLNRVLQSQLLASDNVSERRRLAAFGPAGRYFAFRQRAVSTGKGPKKESLEVADIDFTRNISSMRFGAELPIVDYLFSPDESFLALATPGGILFWEIATNKKGPAIRFPDKRLVSMAYTPDGKSLITLLEPGRGKGGLPIPILRQLQTPWEVKIYESASGKELGGWQERGERVGRMHFCPDGQRLLLCSGADLAIWSLAEKCRLVRFAVPTMESRGIMSSDSGLFRLFTPHNTLWIGETVYANWSPDGQRIVTGSDDGMLRIWDSKTGREEKSIRGHEGMVTGVCWGPDGKQIASVGTDNTVRVWDADSGWELRAYRGHDAFPYEISYSADGRRLVTADAGYNLILWDATVGPECTTCQPAHGEIIGLAFLPGGKELIQLIAPPLLSPSSPSQLWLVNATTGLRSKHSLFVGNQPGAFALNRDASLAAIGGRGDAKGSSPSQANVTLYDPKTLQSMRTLIQAGERVTSVAFHPDGKRLAVASVANTSAPDRTRALGLVCVWNVETGQKLLEIPCHPQGAGAVDFSPDGKWLASGGLGDGCIQIRQADTGKIVTECTGVRAGIGVLAFHPNKAILASPGLGGIALWDITTGKLIRTCRGHTNTIHSLAFTPDGSRLSSGSRDQSIRLWNVASGEEVLTLRGHTHWVRTVAFSSDGTSLASGGVDGTARIWTATPTTPESRKARRKEFADSSANWHRAELEQAIAMEQFFRARFHLTRLIALRPDNPQLLFQKAYIASGQQHWEEARDALVELLDKPAHANDETALRLFALVQWMRGSRAGYRDACTRLVRLLGPSSNAEQISETAAVCVLAADALADYHPLLDAMARVARKSNPDAMFRARQAILLARAGKFGEARNLYVPFGILMPSLPHDGAVAALIYLGLKKPDDARKWLRQAITQIDGEKRQGRWNHARASWQARLEAELLVAEVERLLAAP